MRFSPGGAEECTDGSAGSRRLLQVAGLLGPKVTKARLTTAESLCRRGTGKSGNGNQQTESVGFGLSIPNSARAFNPAQVPANAATAHSQPDTDPEAMPPK